MRYVLSESVMYKFKKYLEKYGNMLSKEQAIEELQDALDSAECTEVIEMTNTNSIKVLDCALSE